MNDRALRQIEIGLGPKANGVERKDGFNITVASEVMAVLCLATSLRDLKERFANMLIAYNKKGEPVYVRDLHIEGRARHDHERCHQAEPDPDAGTQSGHHAWRPVRQYRAWLQLGAGDEDVPETG